MSNLKPLRTPVAEGQPEVALVETRVVAAREEGGWWLVDGALAEVAVSCLVRPEPGDRVLVARGGEGDRIIQILAREPGGSARLEVPGAAEARLEQARLTLLAGERLALQSLGELDLTALGTLRQSAQDQFVHVAGTLVEDLRHHVTRVESWLAEVESLLKIHGRQALVTAEKDLKLDAERISLG